MKRLLIGAAVILTAAAQAQMGAQPEMQIRVGDPYAQHYDRGTVRSIRGEVMYMERFATPQGHFGKVHILTDFGPRTVILAPAHEIERQRISFRRGEFLEVIGSHAVVDGRQVVLARLVGHGPRTYVLRTERGHAVWAPLGVEAQVIHAGIAALPPPVTFGAGRRAEERATTLQPLPMAEVNRMIANWPAKNREVANTMITKYGAPHEATPMRLVWWDNGPWKFSLLVNHEIPHNWPMEHPDMLYQAVNFNVPVDKYSDLIRYDGSLIIERTRGTLGARCDKEEANFLAVNLAYDIINNRRTVEQARDFYAQAVEAMMNNRMSEEQRRYTQGLIFTPSDTPTGDPDRPHRSGN